MRKGLSTWVFLSKNSPWGLEGLCDQWVRELCMSTCHTNHSVSCIKERIQEPMTNGLLTNQRKKNKSIYINLETSDYSSLFSQTFYGLLFSYLTITDVASYVHHKSPVSFLLYIATKKTCQIDQIITVNSSMNAPISETSHKKYSCTPCVPMFVQGNNWNDANATICCDT